MVLNKSIPLKTVSYKDWNWMKSSQSLKKTRKTKSEELSQKTCAWWELVEVSGRLVTNLFACKQNWGFTNSVVHCCHDADVLFSFIFVTRVRFHLYEGLTGEEDWRRVLSFKQSFGPGVKPQPESHSEDCSTCKLQTTTWTFHTLRSYFLHFQGLKFFPTLPRVTDLF